MFKNIKKSVLVSIGIAAASLIVGGSMALANPSYFATGVQTSTSTTTPVFVGNGTATTTLTYDAYAPSTATQKFAANRVGLLIQFASTTTQPTINLSVEYSADGIDWYRNFTIDSNSLGTTTTPYSLATPQSMSWKFASSTTGGAGLTSTNGATTTAAVIIPTPFRYVRVIGSATGGQAAVWMQFVPVKEVF